MPELKIQLLGTFMNYANNDNKNCCIKSPSQFLRISKPKDNENDLNKESGDILPLIALKLNNLHMNQVHNKLKNGEQRQRWPRSLS